MRERGELIKRFGKCPICETIHKSEPIPKNDDCGYPTHCSYEHYNLDLMQHKNLICNMLREVNEDDHDLRSGRRMVEFDFPSAQPLDEQVNLSNWDTFFYTRGFPSLDSKRSLRHVSKLLTYPITIASTLHQYGPYTTRDRLTHEGLKSLTEALSQDIKTLRPEEEIIRIFILDAKAEAQLPLYLYNQISYLFPGVPFHIHFVGPQALPKGGEPHTTHYNHRLSFTWGNNLFNVVDEHEGSSYFSMMGPFDPYSDVFFLFSPGIGQISQKRIWKKILRKLLKTKCSIFITGFDENDLKTEVLAIEGDEDYEFDWLLHPASVLATTLITCVSLSSSIISLAYFMIEYHTQELPFVHVNHIHPRDLAQRNFYALHRPLLSFSNEQLQQTSSESVQQDWEEEGDFEEENLTIVSSNTTPLTSPLSPYLTSSPFHPTQPSVSITPAESKIIANKFLDEIESKL
ncbi:3927_t:CDS:10 [Diversispora eburnea]|uniref:3927_t:CDS:1 n=1 Tax=Diversispora eburnea TaxID=1213867 RepID=A0A9N9ABP2_9GLOM|nr:3927_t:CDS:10 [Diversispora eburnea]